MSIEWCLRKEPCPACGQGNVSVTHRVRRNGWGGIESDTAVSASGCRTEGCAWNHGRGADTPAADRERA